MIVTHMIGETSLKQIWDPTKSKAKPQQDGSPWTAVHGRERYAWALLISSFALINESGGSRTICLRSLIDIDHT